MKKLLCITLLLAATGCSTIINGTEQEIKIVGHENCKINGQPAAPSLVVSRSSSPLKIECEIKPYVTKEAVASALLIDYGVVDAATGAMWGYPETIDLKRIGEF